MDYVSVITLFSLTLSCSRSMTEPWPDRFSLPLTGENDTKPHDSSYSNSKMWQHALLNGSKETFLDSIPLADVKELIKNNIRQQLYDPTSSNMGYQQFPNAEYQPIQNSGFQRLMNIGAQRFPDQSFQQFPSSSYPKIYKLDNIIIIANPSSVQLQSCIPQRPPPLDFPIPTEAGDESDEDNWLSGDEPSKCHWALVACCSPESNKVRYSCFELLGCLGISFDGSPCDPELVEAAAEKTLKYYKSINRGESSRIHLEYHR